MLALSLCLVFFQIVYCKQRDIKSHQCTLYARLQAFADWPNRTPLTAAVCLLFELGRLALGLDQRAFGRLAA